MKDEAERHDPKGNDRAQDAARHPLDTAATPETGEEKMVRSRFGGPAIFGVLAVVVVLLLIVIFLI